MDNIFIDLRGITQEEIEDLIPIIQEHITDQWATGNYFKCNQFTFDEFDELLSMHSRYHTVGKRDLYDGLLHGFDLESLDTLYKDFTVVTYKDFMLNPTGAKKDSRMRNVK